VQNNFKGGIKMQIADIKPGTGNIDLKAEVVGIEAPRELEKYGKKLRVASVTLKDATGTIVLTLWNDEIDKVQEGNVIHIENGYANTWQNKAQLTLGRQGKLTVLE